MKKAGTLKAIFLPKKFRKFLGVSDTETVDLVIEDGEVLVKKQIQNNLEESKSQDD